MSPKITEIFDATCITRFYLYNDVKIFPLESKPFYSLFRKMFKKYRISNEKEMADMTFSMWLEALDWFYENKDNKILAKAGSFPAPNEGGEPMTF